MTVTLTRLAIENRAILESLDQNAAPSTLDAFAKQLQRDPSNLRKSLKGLAAEGILQVAASPGEPQAALTEAGRAVLAGIYVAEGRLQAGLPVLTRDQVTPDPDQPRKQFDQAELEELAESIADRGLLEPILVRLTSDSSAQLVAGERRWRAIGILIAAADPRWPADRSVPYHLSVQTEDAEILADQVVENLQRAKLHPLEEADAFRTLKVVHGWGVGRIAKTASKTRRFIEQRLDLLTLTPVQQGRMRLAKDHPEHLTPSRAREMVQHLRQISGAALDQRDIEEIAPGADVAAVSAEAEAAARKPKLTPRELMILGEIAAASVARRSVRFPDSPRPVVDVDSEKAVASEALGRLSSAKFAALLIDGQAEDSPAGARVEDLGHLRLRLENLHPADNPRALFHLRREAGLSADQARQLQKLDQWATPFLSLTPPATAAEDPAVAEMVARLGAIPASDLLALVEIAARVKRKQHVAYGAARLFHELPERFERAYYPGLIMTIVDFDGGERKQYVRLHTTVEAALSVGGFWRDDMDADTALRIARTWSDAWTPRALALGEYATDWLSFRGQTSRPSPTPPTASPHDYLARWRSPLHGAAAKDPYGSHSGTDWHSPAERLILLELADKSLNDPQTVAHAADWTAISSAPPASELGGLHGGIVTFGEALRPDSEVLQPAAKLHFSAGTATESGGIHGALTRLGFYSDRQAALEKARLEAGFSQADLETLAEGELYATPWLNTAAATPQAEPRRTGQVLECPVLAPAWRLPWVTIVELQDAAGNTGYRAIARLGSAQTVEATEFLPNQPFALARKAEGLQRRLRDVVPVEVMDWLDQLQGDHVVDGHDYYNASRAAEARAARDGEAPGADDPAILGDLTKPQIRVLREVGFAEQASAAGLGEPVPVGQYWLDADAVGLWKRAPDPLLSFTAAPGSTWTVCLTDVGRNVVRLLNVEMDPLALTMRVEREGYSCAWLRHAGTPIGEQLGVDRGDDDAAEESELLIEIRAALAAGAPDPEKLLKLVGLAGDFVADADAGITLSPKGGGTLVYVAAADPHRLEPEDLACARAELIAFALNAFARSAAHWPATEAA
ncbi:ParB/RepB/Spo0J family partition protein [Brevundimonas sp.]|uniref:ParB/RepB/Spo0J family partition protein n=1 Tax=Brevundimonas sp. TaxID=1871086 RepID=UPI00286A1C9C|nr:ParB/RepB/Spo0J family partition protein [Brevundimonas sp.]